MDNYLICSEKNYLFKKKECDQVGNAIYKVTQHIPTDTSTFNAALSELMTWGYRVQGRINSGLLRNEKEKPTKNYLQATISQCCPENNITIFLINL